MRSATVPFSNAQNQLQMVNAQHELNAISYIQ